MSIVIENLCKNFGTHAVLQNFNWTVDRPMVLMGASGCGKTTLLRILSGLETADSGTVTGVVTPAVVFQEDRLCPQLTAVDNLVLTGHGLTAAQARSDLQSLGFTEADLRLPAVQLSGGQKRRAALLRALAVPGCPNAADGRTLHRHGCRPGAGCRRRYPPPGRGAAHDFGHP